MIVQNSDFKGRFNIANVEDVEPNSDLVGNNEAVDIAIQTYEPECLIIVLGYSLYAELKPELDKKPWNSGSPDTADQKWIDLVDGKERYLGLKALLVPYIFFKFLQEDESFHSGVGVAKGKPKGADNFNPSAKAVNAWREYYKNTMGQNSYPQIVQKTLTPGTVVGVIHADDSDKHQGLYSFLKENSDVYPNAVMTTLHNMNYYGI